MIYVFLSYNSWRNFARYETPELALSYDKSVHADEILKVLQCNDVAEIFYVEDGTIYSRRAFKVSGGWMGVSEYAPLPKYRKMVNHVSVTYHVQGNKHIISMSALPDSIIAVEDSLNSQIEYYKDTLYGTQNWLLVLDELPDNYYLTINGEKVYLK